MVFLQLALDLTILERAIQIAKEAVEGGVDWIEVGTPLIKSEGMNAVRTIKKMFKDKVIVADMKTMDVGGVEAEIAAKSGADVIIILGVSDDETIKEAVNAANKYGSKIMVDLINTIDPVKRAQEVEKLGASYVCVHVGVDQQMKGMDPIDILKKVSKTVNIPVAVAGGINSETAPLMVENGAYIIIVGGAIIKAENVTEAAKRIKESITKMEKIKTDLFKKYTLENVRDALIKVSTPNISDAMHRKGAIHGLNPILPKGGKMVGPALTVRTIDGDWAKPVEAIDKAEPGQVIVIDVAGGETAVWGELASWSAKVKGISGVVINGAVRDIDFIKEINFPVFAKYIVPNAGEPKGYGEIGVELEFGGQKIRTGDWIVGDESGLVVIPKENVVEIANRALDVLERENRLREEIKRGSTLSKVSKLEEWEKVG
ncbi:MAG: 3-hexulose-6-phosphate synthase [Thermoplasmata archaeon]|jgi:3-hexulose-6-phosphate synthase/6-phospho-3-hexuloisomerase